MGALEARVNGWNRARLGLIAGLLVALAGLVVGVGTARAGGCTDNWTGNADSNWFNSANWSTNAVPTISVDACIPANKGTVLIDGKASATFGSAAAAHSLIVNTGDTLQLRGFDDNGILDAATLNLASPSSIAAGGEIELTAGCAPNGCTSGASSTLNIQGNLLTNDGTILSDPGSDSGSNARQLNGNISNAGTTSLNADLTLYGSGSQFTNASGGSVTNNGGASSLLMKTNTTFVEGAGTTSPSTANPANPAVVMDNPTFLTYPTVSYTGTGASTVVVHGGSNLSGNLASGQNLVIAGGSAANCNSETVVTATNDFSNAGTITLNGNGCSGLQFPGHTLTNTGTINATPTGAGITREIKGGLSNSGTLNLKGDTAFDGSGAALSQTAGTTTLGPGKFLDLTGSNGTFQLHGGLLQAPGSNQPNQSGITGNLNNLGGNVAPGSPTLPGDMAVVGHYTQGSSGRLTAVIKGNFAGGTYSQLAVTQGSTLAGTLDIITPSGSFTPQAGKLFTVVGGSTRTGKFTKLIGQFVTGKPVGYKVLYQPTNVTLQAATTFRLRVARGGTQQGAVTSSPAGINCGTKCSALFFKSQVVTLTEHPVAGHKFTGWSGACTGKTTTCKVTMTKAQGVTATFS
jgi:Divergent InlB B-repeat domain